MLSILLSYTLLPVAHAATFSYTGGVNGPLVWHKQSPEWTLCASGRNQSPLDIPTIGTASVSVLFEYPAKGDFKINITRHSIQLDPKNPEQFRTSIGKKRYQLLEFHFHTPSEHFLDGEHFPIELHFVLEQVGGTFPILPPLPQTRLHFPPLTLRNRAWRLSYCWNICRDRF